MPVSEGNTEIVWRQYRNRSLLQCSE